MLGKTALYNAYWLNSKAQPLVGLYSSSTKERYSGAAPRPPPLLRLRLPLGAYLGDVSALGATLVVFFNLDFAKNAKAPPGHSA